MVSPVVKEPCSTRWCPRSWSLDRPRTGGGRREHRHARGARRDARRRAAGAAGWHGHALRCRPTRDARRDRTTATSRRVMRIPVPAPVPVRMPTCLTRDESRGPCVRTGDEVLLGRLRLRGLTMSRGQAAFLRRPVSLGRTAVSLCLDPFTRYAPHARQHSAWRSPRQEHEGKKALQL